MRTLHIALVALPLLALGCRADPNQVLLEQESRMLEDKVYHLQALLDDCHAAREATIRENEALKKELAGGDRGPGADSRGPALELPGDSATPRRSPRGKAPKLEAPIIELPEPSDTPPTEKMPGGDESTFVDGQPTQLVINKRLTGGMDRDGHNGDEGILVVVEPRDAQGQLVKTPGAVSVVVMDPALEGDATRVARWDFASREVTNHFQNTAFGSGLHFELPWPGRPPQNRDLRLFVRFTTADGTKINADAPIEVRAASDPPRVDRQTKNWSPNENPKRSRLKSSRPTAAAPRDFSASGDSATGDERDAAGQNAAAGSPESLRQATRPDRPVWKPFR